MELDRRTCERARLSRDPRFDGRFFICVTTTGIYCRPICPARTSKSANVRYVASAAAAQAAGFRPCLRCRPESSPGSPAWRGTSTIVVRALRLIDEGALDDAGIAALAQRVGVTSRHLTRLFVRHVGAPPLEVALIRRVHFAKKLIDETRLPFDEVAYAAGYGSVRRFNAEIRRSFTRTPTQLRRLARQPGDAEAGTYAFRLAYRPPYDWAGAIRYFDAHALAGVESVEPGRYARTIDHAGSSGTIAVTHDAEHAALHVEVRFPEARALLAIVDRVRRMFDVLAVPDLIADHLGEQPALRRALSAHPGVRCVRPWSGFELAIRTLVPAAGPSASAFGAPLRAPPLDRVFPTSAQLCDAPLERRGVAAAVARTVRALARGVVAGAIRFDGTDSATLAGERARVPGLAAELAQGIATRALDEPDSFDPRDPLARAEQCRPWRAYAERLRWHARHDAG